ncbi:guaD [Scenedesmus sp. PABB004]|nr:guaD [Scenedesmus sp. PABB004]
MARPAAEVVWGVLLCALLAGMVAAQGPAASAAGVTAVRGAFLDYLDDPFYNGTILAFGPYAEVSPKFPGVPTTAYKEGNVIMPGFIDTHVHYVQSRVTGAYGLHKPEWLQAYIFPEEIKCKNASYARTVANWFLDEMLRAGTTTVQSFTMTARIATDVFFEEAAKRNMRVIAGVTGVDRPGEGPPGYTDTAAQFERDSVAMYNKWHGKGRALYAVTPRYAPGVTNALLAKAGHLFKTLPGVYMNTHLAEVTADVETVKKLFPNATDYYNVFEMHGLVGPRTTFGHSIYLSPSEFERMSKQGSGISFCPASNLFLGSGLFKLATAKGTKTPVRVGLGTDMAGGDYFSQLKVLNNGYKVAMLQNYPVSGLKLLFLPMLGAARALYLDDRLGSFTPGREADFVVLNATGTRELAFRANGNVTIGTDRDRLEFLMFGVAVLGDERVVAATYVAGKRLYSAA